MCVNDNYNNLCLRLYNVKILIGFLIVFRKLIDFTFNVVSINLDVQQLEDSRSINLHYAFPASNEMHIEIIS